MAELLHVRGLRDLQERLRTFPARVQKRVLNASLMAGARVISAEAQRLAPVLQPDADGQFDDRRKPGALRKRIRPAVVRPFPGMASTVTIAVRGLSAKKVAAFKAATGKLSTQNPDDPFYWRFANFGTKNQKGSHFLERAFETKGREALNVIRTRLALRIAEEAAKQL